MLPGLFKQRQVCKMPGEVGVRGMEPCSLQKRGTNREVVPQPSPGTPGCGGQAPFQEVEWMQEGVECPSWPHQALC